MDTTINIAHITRIEPNPENDGTAIMYSAGEKEIQIHTPAKYEDVLDCLVTFWETEVLEILPDQINQA
ncbi:MAG: hypothetical protein LCH91_13755 [Bacteroidetes bacterium]|nr:hypothetical protein [Bacteroidota bacterium]